MLKGENWNCVCAREGVKSGYRSKKHGTLVKHRKNQLLRLQVYDNWASLVIGDPSIVMLGYQVEIFEVITLAGRINQVKNRTAGNTLFMHIASLAHVISPYCELYCHPVGMWKLWNLLPSWFVYVRIWLNLINPRVLKIDHCKWRCWTLPLLRIDREIMQLVYGVILLDKILRNHLLSENMQWNKAWFNDSFNYLTHKIVEFCVKSLALNNWE